MGGVDGGRPSGASHDGAPAAVSSAPSWVSLAAVGLAFWPIGLSGLALWVLALRLERIGLGMFRSAHERLRRPGCDCVDCDQGDDDDETDA